MKGEGMGYQIVLDRIVLIVDSKEHPSAKTVLHTIRLFSIYRYKKNSQIKLYL